MKMVVWMEKQHKAFLFLDFLFAILPILLMLVAALNASNILLSNYENQINDQILLDKLISVSDLVVRYEAVEKNSIHYLPNKLSESEFSSLNIEELKEKMNLEYLHISFEQGEGTCIYRLVLYKEEIEKLYFCGELK